MTLSVLLCPSDPGTGSVLSNPTPQRKKGNYVINWGNAHWNQTVAPNPFNGPAGAVDNQRGPFRSNNATNPNPFGLRDMTDGTSNTLLMSEIIAAVNDGSKYDVRGDVWSQRDCGFMFLAYTTPNSKTPDQIKDSAACVSPFARNPPCTQVDDQFNAARSFHPGGVDACLGDGSVRYFKDSINVATWRALSTPQGSELISADQL